jgi:hypothetical protein
VTIVATVVLVLAGEAAAHVNVSPGLLETGRESTLRIELPELRPGLQPSALAVSGRGVRVLGSSSTGRLGAESRWRVRVEIEAEPGPLALTLVARYSDGRSVTVRQALTVIPSSEATSSSSPVLAAGIGVLALLAAVAAAVLFRRARRV